MRRSDPMQAAIEALARSDQLTASLRQKLTVGGYSEAEIESTLTQLSEWGLLNDLSLSEHWAQRASEHPSKGRLRIAEELVRRGVDESLAETLANAVLSDDDERARAQAMLKERFADRKNPAKAARLLAGRGFDPDLIQSLIEDFFGL